MSELCLLMLILAGCGSDKSLSQQALDCNDYCDGDMGGNGTSWGCATIEHAMQVLDCCQSLGDLDPYQALYCCDSIHINCVEDYSHPEDQTPLCLALDDIEAECWDTTVGEQYR